jgi:hypothetical protein
VSPRADRRTDTTRPTIRDVTLAGVLALPSLWRADILTWMPLTLDTHAWYFGQSLIVLLLIGALATYGFLVALGGRPAFGVMPAQ